jgi:hypothetical protein
MAVQKPRADTRQGLKDPLCHVKTTEELVNADYNPKEVRNTEAGKWYENRRVHLLLSHCKDKDPERVQQDDPGHGDHYPLPDDELKPKFGGPLWSTRKHHKE